MKEQSEVIPYFIGYDRTEIKAYEVCEFSARRHTTMPLFVSALERDSLRRIGLYRRAPDENSMIDSVDGKPYSTEFSFTRFLVPHLMQYQGWALFSDCDFLWRRDLAALWKWRDPNYAVMVVKHDYRPEETTKMQGQVQERYHRKNWSSMILWNCSHPANMRLSVDDVNNRTGSWLHGFKWLEDDEIGAIVQDWNFLEGHSKGALAEIKALHYTRGGPWFEQCRDVDWAHLWLAEQKLMHETMKAEAAE